MSIFTFLLFYGTIVPSAEQAAFLVVFVLVLGNELALRYSPIVTIIPLTGHSTKRMDIPCHVIVGPDETSNGLSVNSVVLCEQIRTVPKEWIFAYKGSLTPQAMELVLTAMNRQLVG